MNTEIPQKLKERFCRDCNLPIKIFEEPYFTERLKLLDTKCAFPGIIEQYNKFAKKIQSYNNPQDFLEEYNKVKDDAINFIKETEAYQKFNEMDMNEFAKKIRKGLPSHDIFKPQNAGKYFISIDMRKANFNALKNYDTTIFGKANTWEDFLSKFTNNSHIITSKYIRQVILGNCNPKRHVTYEKYLMNKFIDKMEEYFDADFLQKIVFFSNDEIVLDVTAYDETERTRLSDKLNSIANNFLVPLKIESFRLYKIKNTDGYLKDGTETQEIKCLDSVMYPIVLRKIIAVNVQEYDKVFIFNGMRAKLIDIPKIEFLAEPEQ